MTRPSNMLPGLRDRGTPTLRLMALVAVVAVGAFLVAHAVASPSVDQWDLAAGDEVSLRSGLTFVVPPASSGSFTSRAAGWMPREEDLGYPLEPAEEVFLEAPGTAPGGTIALDAVWSTEEGPASLGLLRRQALGSGPAYSGVEVRWMKPVRGIYNVYILCSLPQRLPGVIMFEDPTVTDARGAWTAARGVWQGLSVLGAEFPPPPIDGG
jgi:hypothetical protein